MYFVGSAWSLVWSSGTVAGSISSHSCKSTSNQIESKMLTFDEKSNEKIDFDTNLWLFLSNWWRDDRDELFRDDLDFNFTIRDVQILVKLVVA